MVGGGRGGEEKGHHGQGHARGQRGTMAKGVHGILNLGATQAGGRRCPTTVVERENESKKKTCNMTGRSYIMGKIIGDLQKRLPQ
jgi:hypothetical protein